MLGKDCPVRDGGLAVSVHDRHALGIERFASNEGVQDAGLRFGRAVKHRQIRFPYVAVVLEFAAQGKIGALCAGEHHHSACVSVETVNHTGAFVASDACHVRKILQEDVAQRPIRISGRTVYYNARRLVHDDDVVIRMEYFNGYLALLFHLLLWYSRQWQNPSNSGSLICSRKFLHMHFVSSLRSSMHGQYPPVRFRPS